MKTKPKAPQTVADLDDNLLDETPQDKAFVTSAVGKTIKGVKLSVYTATHSVATEALGMRWGKLTAKEIDEFRNTGSYRGVVADVYTTLYVLTLSEDEVDELTVAGPDEIKAARKAAFAWAEKLGLRYPTEGFAEAYEVYLSLISEVAVSSGEFEKVEGDGADSGGKKS